MPATTKLNKNSLEISQEEELEFRKRLDLVLFGFAHWFPFWGILSERCRYSLTKNNLFCPTACVDKNGHIIFNFEFVATLSNEQFLFLVAHEICHFVFEHAARMGSREHMLWNIAADYAINLMLHYQFNNMKYIIKDIVFDDSWKNGGECKYDGLTAESIYEDLKNDKDNKFVKAMSSGNSPKDIIVYVFDESESGGEGNLEGEIKYVEIRGRRVPLPNKAGKSSERISQEMKDHVRKAITEAFTISKSQGNLPANFERAIHKILKPKIDWFSALRQRLRHGVSRMEKRDTTWMIPNRRFLGGDFIFPSNTGPESPKICYAIDTSGSMSQEDMTKGISELEEIRKRFNAKVYFLDCDANVYSSRWINPNEPLPKLVGGGGTDFRPVFAHLNDKRIKPDYCIFFTDGYGEFGENQKGLNVLWVMTSNVVPPFGDVIRYNVMQE
jgi:predicted metal-dependent peptidase